MKMKNARILSAFENRLRARLCLTHYNTPSYVTTFEIVMSITTFASATRLSYSTRSTTDLNYYVTTMQYDIVRRVSEGHKINMLVLRTSPFNSIRRSHSLVSAVQSCDTSSWFIRIRTSLAVDY